MIELFNDFPYLSIGIADTGCVVFADFKGEGGISVRIFVPALVFHELARAMPGGFSRWFFRVGGWREFGIFIEGEVFGRSSEREVGTEDAGGEEERFLIFRKAGKLFQGFIDSGSIRVGVIVSFMGLEEVHVFCIDTNFSVRETVHPATGMLPLAGWEEVLVPRVWHFELGVIVPIFSAASTGVMGNFSDRDRGVTILAEISG